MFGYTINVTKEMQEKSGESDLLKIQPKKQKAPSSNCDLCSGEDMFIKGTKSLIPCPKCNRNKNKFRSNLLTNC